MQGEKVAKKSPGIKSPGGGPKGITKGGKNKMKVVKVQKKKEAPKKSIEDLDAELMSYTAARGAEDAAAEATA